MTRESEGCNFKDVERCPLCLKIKTEPYCITPKLKKFFKCNFCSLVFLTKSLHLSHEEERIRYESHQNNCEDLRYQNFVKPLVEAITQRLSQNALGLDYGCGPGPVVTKLLRDQGYQIELYDPFFHKNPHVLQKKYDFIFCSEVAEHFNHPAKEFKKLRDLLNPSGFLFVFTHLLTSQIEFKDWYYKNDPTHVSFYSKESLQWIQEHLDFNRLTMKEPRLAIFSLHVARSE